MPRDQEEGSLQERARRLAEEAASLFGAEVVDVELVSRGRRRLLRVLLDREGGIDLETCARVSEELSRALDREDFIPGPYTLEVGSPGVERPLRNLRDFRLKRGREVEVRTSQPLGGRQVFRGRVVGIDEEGEAVILEEEGERIHLPLDAIAAARQVVKL